MEVQFDFLTFYNNKLPSIIHMYLIHCEANSFKKSYTDTGVGQHKPKAQVSVVALGLKTWVNMSLFFCFTFI